jgi:hypothetical protein
LEVPSDYRVVNTPAWSEWKGAQGKRTIFERANKLVLVARTLERCEESCAQENMWRGTVGSRGIVHPPGSSFRIEQSVRSLFLCPRVHVQDTGWL